ncbi:MAG: carbohydrate kinase family protein [Immundisolibacterales bacterium]|nr:carbohydrate kinase family protein [Immundisolibacterales bacterium]
MRPDLILLGQTTVDHVVPARPGAWRERLGGNALYAAAGARLWIEPERIGVVTRVGAGCPFDPRAHLARAGIERVAIAATRREQLVEWFLYEEDGSRRSLPRNRALRDAGGEGAGAGPEYLAHLEAQSPSAADVPAQWLPVRAVHIAPQVLARHEESLRTLAPQSGFVSLDPSPHYSTGRSVEALAFALAPATALLPSEREVAHLVGEDGWTGLGQRLAAAGFPEVVIKRGAAGAILCERGRHPERVAPLPVAVRDPTGAGDAFCGAYAACRLQGHPPTEAARRATVAASMVIECEGADTALALSPNAARRRLES